MEPFLKDVEPDPVDRAVVAQQLVHLLEALLPKRRVQRLVPGRPSGAEHDRLAFSIEQRPLVELRVAVADGVEVDHQRQSAALAGRRQFAQEIPLGLEVRRLRVVEHQPVDPLVVEHDVACAGLLEVLHPAIGVELVAEVLQPLLHRVAAQRLVNKAGHDADRRRLVPERPSGGPRLGRQPIRLFSAQPGRGQNEAHYDAWLFSSSSHGSPQHGFLMTGIRSFRLPAVPHAGRVHHDKSQA